MPRILTLLVALVLLTGSMFTGIRFAAAEGSGAVTSTVVVNIDRCVAVPDAGETFCVTSKGVVHFTQTPSENSISMENRLVDCFTVTDTTTGALIGSQCFRNYHTLDRLSADGNRVIHRSYTLNLSNGTVTCTVTIRFLSVNGHEIYDDSDLTCV